MNLRSFAVSLALTLAALTVGGAARADELTLDGFAAEVLARNPSLKARALRRGALREEARAAGACPDPSLSVMLDRVPMGAEMPMIRYQLSQMLPWPGKLDLMRSAVERQGDAAAAQVEARRLDVVLEARRGWYMLVINKKRREVNRAGRSLAATGLAQRLHLRARRQALLRRYPLVAGLPHRSHPVSTSAELQGTQEADARRSAAGHRR
jgi:cobalt-zinc-cadmium efflux system outer membrane protein